MKAQVVISIVTATVLIVVASSGVTQPPNRSVTHLDRLRTMMGALARPDGNPIGTPGGQGTTKPDPDTPANPRIPRTEIEEMAWMSKGAVLYVTSKFGPVETQERAREIVVSQLGLKQYTDQFPDVGGPGSERDPALKLAPTDDQRALIILALFRLELQKALRGPAEQTAVADAVREERQRINRELIVDPREN